MSFLDSVITSYYEENKQTYYKNIELIKKHNELISSCEKVKKSLNDIITNELAYKYEVIAALQKKVLPIYNTIKKDKVFLNGYIYILHKKEIESFVKKCVELNKIKNRREIVFNINRLSNRCIIFNKDFNLLQKSGNMKKFIELEATQYEYKEIYKELTKWKKRLTKEMEIDISNKITEIVTLFFKDYMHFENIMNSYKVVFNKNISTFIEANFQLCKTIKSINYRNFNKYSYLLEKYSRLYNDTITINDIGNYNFISEITDYVFPFNKHYERLNKLCNVYWKLDNLLSRDKDSERVINNIKEILEKNRYIDYLLRTEFKEKYLNLYNQVVKDYNLIKESGMRDYKFEYMSKFKKAYETFDQIVNDYNLAFIKSEKLAYEHIFQNVEGKVLDNQQIESIIKDEMNNLVIAGAGSGKTTTILGKIKYLIERGFCLPEQLLIISFTNTTANELYGRVLKETRKKNIDVMTFHKLGVEIISNVEELKPDIFNTGLPDFVTNEFKCLTKDQSYLKLVNQYFLSYLKPFKSRFDFENEGQFIKYLKSNNIRTLKDEPVKSLEEMEISNFLFLSGIEYEYERPYEFDTRTKEKAQYKPDFYLPKEDIYIEHFGIDRNGNVPSFFNGKTGISAQKIYNDSISWKRATHKKNRTKPLKTVADDC